MCQIIHFKVFTKHIFSTKHFRKNYFNLCHDIKFVINWFNRIETLIHCDYETIKKKPNLPCLHLFIKACCEMKFLNSSRHSFFLRSLSPNSRFALSTNFEDKPIATKVNCSPPSNVCFCFAQLNFKSILKVNCKIRN